MTYEAEANYEYGRCTCPTTDCGECEWCDVYYGRDMELIALIQSEMGKVINGAGFIFGK